jgi:hypothetical protein
VPCMLRAHAMRAPGRAASAALLPPGQHLQGTAANCSALLLLLLLASLLGGGGGALAPRLVVLPVHLGAGGVAVPAGSRTCVVGYAAQAQIMQLAVTASPPTWQSCSPCRP